MYSERKTGFSKNMSFNTLKSVFSSLFKKYFTQKKAYLNIYPEYTPEELNRFFTLYTKDDKLVPEKFDKNINTEEELFDMIEVGLHFLSDNYRTKVNSNRAFLLEIKHHDIEKFGNESKEALKQYGYTIKEGTVQKLPESEFAPLADSVEPILDSKKYLNSRFNQAQKLFYKKDASLEDKRSACIELAAIAEKLRKDAKKLEVSSDFEDLFNIVNNFDIRHNKKTTKKIEMVETLDWIFYAFINSIVFYFKMIDRSKE